MKTEMPPYVRKTLVDIEKELSVRRDEVTALDSEIKQLEITRSSLLEMYEAEPAAPVAVGKPVRKAKGAAVKPARACRKVDVATAAREILSAPASAPAAAAPTEKPTTIGGLMKMYCRQLGKFTRQELKELLLKDTDAAKLMGQSPTAFCGNLLYWSNTGRLKRIGEGENERFEVVTMDF